jgi:hypothetical protein
MREIQAEIHGAKNRKREAMNGALISIGGSRESLRAKAIATARAIGPVAIDHGDTDCKTADAVSYIQKMAGRKKAAGKPTTKGRAPAR